MATAADTARLEDLRSRTRNIETVLAVFVEGKKTSLAAAKAEHTAAAEVNKGRLSPLVGHRRRHRPPPSTHTHTELFGFGVGQTELHVHDV